MKIHSKIAVLVLLLIFLTTISITSVIFIELNNVEDEVEKELIQLGIDDAKKDVYNTYLMIEALHTGVNQRLRHDLDIAHLFMDQAGSLIEQPISRQWEALNQYDHSAFLVRLPTLVLSDQQRQQQVTTDQFVQNVANVLGVSCTLFQRMNRSGDMLRVSSTLPTPQGKSAVGTYLPARHPDGHVDAVVSQILSGEVFVGRTYEVSDWYNSAYMPLYNREKSQVIGMLYVGERQADMQPLYHAIDNISLGDNSHIFMLQSSNSQGGRRFVGNHVHEHETEHHNIEQDKRVQEYFQWMEVEGYLNKSELVQVVHDVGDKKHDEHHGHATIVAYCYYEPWDWVVGVSYRPIYLNSAHARLDQMIDKTLGFVCAVAFVGFSIALLIAYRLAGDISRPLEQAVIAFNKVGQGDLDYKLGTAKGYEIEQLYESFNVMLKNLRQVTTSRDQLDSEINSRKEVELELQKALTALETVINEAPLSIVVLDAKGIVKLWNPGAERMFGWQKDEVIGTTYPLINHGSLEEVKNNYEIVRHGVQFYAKEAQRFDKHGNCLDLLISAAPMESGDSEHVSFVVIHEDISPLKHAQRQLEEREEEYKLLSSEFKSILDGIQDVISVIGPDMRIRWSNHGQRRWNFRESKLPQTACYTLWNKDESMCKDCPVRDCFETGQPHSAKITSPDGTRWGVKAFPQFDAQGNVMNVIEVASDITEAVVLREETFRSARLASLGELAAGIAHEINNPNGVILHNAPIMKEIIGSALPLLDTYSQEHGDFQLGRLPYSRLRDTIEQLPERIIDSGQRIKNIVDDLKNFVRDEGDSHQHQAVDLNHVLAVAIRLTQNTIKQVTRHFEVHYDEEIPPFKGSEQRIEQVIVNLLMNSCQALQSVEDSIIVRTMYNPLSEMVELEVRDQGEGIKEEDLIKVTNPFFTTKRETGGTGLGLSISTRIIEEHAGLIQIDSTVGKGTSIVVSLPAVKEA